MERATFLIESSGARLSCLLNPASIVVRRTAGLRTRRSLMGQASGNLLADSPLLFTGGGRTEFDLELFFDISLAGSSVVSEDVRDLTHPLWALAENRDDVRSERRPPALRFVWGKAWNVPVVVCSVAERLEHFTHEGLPRRSWLTMRLLRVLEASTDVERERSPSPGDLDEAARNVPIEDVTGHELVGDVSAGEGERLDELAQRYYGDPSYWRLLANYNNIDDPHGIDAGTVLQIPPAPSGTADS